jgi:hypothetical protein
MGFDEVAGWVVAVFFDCRVDARFLSTVFFLDVVAGLLVCGGHSSACRRPSHFSLLAQREVTKRNGLLESADPTSLGA